MSYPIDLSVTGKPSPRTNDRVSSMGRRKAGTPCNLNKERNQKSNIFHNNATEQYNKNVAGVISKRELESVKKLTTPTKNKGQAIYPSPRKTAPKGVPQLSFDDVVEKDDDLTYNKIGPQDGTDIPSSKETYSWGTTMKNNNKIPKGGGWQVNQSRQLSQHDSSHRKPEDVPNLNLQLSQSNGGLLELREAAKKVKEETHIEYIGGGYKAQNKKKPQQAQSQTTDYYNMKKAAFVEETFLMDQTTNLKITDEKPPSTNSYAVANQQRFNSKMKRHQDMYSSSSINPSHVDNNLSRRLHFSARILSLDGHDARRDINGFLFIDDSSLTIYEFKQFGTKSKALPLIQRDVYKHLSGVRHGWPYSILDISVGKDLSFHTEKLTSLPDSLLKKKVLMFRITDVKEEDKEALLQAYCRSIKSTSVYKLKEAYDEDESLLLDANKDVLCIQSRIRKQVQSHGRRLFTNLYRHFKLLDNREKDGVLDEKEFNDALKKFHVVLTEKEFTHIWKYVDRNHDGLVDYGEFVRGCFGEMSEARKYWVRKAFSRIDPSKSGTGKIIDIEKFYCPGKDPAVIEGKLEEKEALENLIECFKDTKQKTSVSYTEFEAYYEGFSLSYTDDEIFINVIKATWTI